MREGDLIVGFAGHPVAGIDQLHRLLTGERAGKSASVEVIRGTERLVFKVTPQEMRR